MSIEKFDADIYLFNCKNGTLDLRDGTFREHRADDFVTKISPVEYVPSARSERFEKFIDEITCQDKGRARFLQKTLGYGLSGDTRFECMFFYFGETTRNGKGTLMETVLITFGDYGATVRPETIATKYNPNSQNPWDGCIKCHHWSFDRKYHDSSVCNPCGIRFLTIYHRKIIEYLIRGRLAKIIS